MTMHKFIYFGTPYIARDTLAALMEAGYTPLAVVTSPDRPQGRGLTLMPSSTKAFANERGIPVLSPEKLDEAFILELAKLNAEYAVVVAYGKLLPEQLITAFPKGVFNVHYSLLPAYRGASPVEAALLNGDARTGVSLQRMVKEMDAGDLLLSRSIPVESQDTTIELRQKLIPLGAQLLIEALPLIESGQVTYTPQDPGKATFAPKISKTDGELHMPGDDELNWRKYRAFKESPGTYFFFDRGCKRMRVKIAEAQMIDGTFTPLRVIPEGKREMDYQDFIRSAG